MWRTAVDDAGVSVQEVLSGRDGTDGTSEACFSMTLFDICSRRGERALRDARRQLTLTAAEKKDQDMSLRSAMPAVTYGLGG